MVSQQMLISVALPVAAMAIVGASVANVQDNTLAPGLDTLEAATQFGYPEVTVENEDQLRGLTVFNMLSAQNCIYSAMVYHREAEAPQDMDIEGGYQPLEMKEIEPPLGNLGQSQFTYFGHGDVLRDALELEGFDGVCLGGKEISITEAMAKQLDSYKAYLQIEGAWEFATQPWNYGYGPSADSEALNRGALQGRYGRIEFQTEETILIRDKPLMGMHLNDRITDSGWGKAKSPDFIRGARAAVFFPSGLLGTENAVNKWKEGRDPGMISEGDIEGIAGVAGAAPGAAVVATSAAGAVLVLSGPVGWAVGLGGVALGGGMAWWGSEAAASLAEELNIGKHPGILLGIDASSDPQERARSKGWYENQGMFDYREKDGMGWREDMNAFRVRMKNIPLVMSPGFYKEDMLDWNDVSKQMGYNYIVKNSNYVVCNGTRGFIQSNAGSDIEYSGKEEAQNKNPIPRDVVYPRIEATTYKADCLSDAVWSPSSDYHVMWKFKPHIEFIDDGEFVGPIVDEPGFAVPGGKNGLLDMYNDATGEFEKTVVEDAVVLTPDTTVDLKLGLRPVRRDGIGYWNAPNTFYAPNYRVSAEQCEEYRDTYELTRMFSDQRRSVYLPPKISEDLKGELTEEPRSYELIEEDGEYRVKITSGAGNFGRVPITYNFDRFSAERIEAKFDLDVSNVENLPDLISEDQVPDYQDTPLVGFYFHDKGEEKSYGWIEISLRKIGYGSSNLEETYGEKYQAAVPVSERASDIVDPNSRFKELYRYRPNSGYDGKIPAPTDRKFKIIVVKEGDNPRLIMKGRVRVKPEGSEPEWAWSKLFSTDFKSNSANVDIEDIERMEIKSVYPPGQQSGRYLADTTIEDVSVRGTITGCPQPGG